MSLVIRSYAIVTAADGTLSTINGVVSSTIPARGRVCAVGVVNSGTLTGGGTLKITDANTGLVICNDESFTDFTSAKQKAFSPVSKTDANGDDLAEIADSYVSGFATGTLTIAVTGGGNAKSGVLWLVWEV